MEEILREIYSALDDVLRKGAYINIVFNGEFEHRSQVTFVVKGTVEHYFELTYALDVGGKDVRAGRERIHKCRVEKV